MQSAGAHKQQANLGLGVKLSLAVAILLRDMRPRYEKSVLTLGEACLWLEKGIISVSLPSFQSHTCHSDSSPNYLPNMWIITVDSHYSFSFRKKKANILSMIYKTPSLPLLSGLISTKFIPPQQHWPFHLSSNLTRSSHLWALHLLFHLAIMVFPLISPWRIIHGLFPGQPIYNYNFLLLLYFYNFLLFPSLSLALISTNILYIILIYLVFWLSLS